MMQRKLAQIPFLEYKTLSINQIEVLCQGVERNLDYAIGNATGHNNPSECYYQRTKELEQTLIRTTARFRKHDVKPVRDSRKMAGVKPHLFFVTLDKMWICLVVI